MGKVKKAIFSLIAIVTVLSVFVACNDRQQQGDEDMLINIVIDRGGVVYFISLSSEGVLTTSDGWWGLSEEEKEQFLGGYWLSEERQFTAGVFHPTNADHFLRNIRETAYVELTQEQLQELVDLMSQITDDDFTGWAVADGVWYVYVVYGGKVFSYFLRDIYAPYSGWGSKPHMRELIRALIEYSPIDIYANNPLGAPPLRRN